MKNKILKVLTVLTLLTVLTMTNFIYVSAGLISYAVDGIDTVEFSAEINQGENISLGLNVPNSSDFYNGKITLREGECNFKFARNQSNQYVKEINKNGNEITLNTISAGTNAKIDLKIEPIKDEIFNIGLLNMTSKINFSGNYKDRQGRENAITQDKEVKYEYKVNNTNENVENTAKIITNKIVKVSGEDKRVVQLEMKLGLKENDYPIKQIELNMDVPSAKIDVDNATTYESPSVEAKNDFNTMTNYKLEYKNSKLNILFKNEAKDSKVLWKKQGSEKVVITFIYNKDAKLDNVGEPRVKVTLYDGTELNSVGTIQAKDLEDKLNQEQLVDAVASNKESTIYKGKLKEGIDREFTTKTNIAVNLANAEEYINVKEENNYIVNDKEVAANVVYNKTTMSKKEFEKAFEVLGEEGKITFLNEKNEELASIDKTTSVDGNNNVVIDYSEKEPQNLIIKTTVPKKQGNINFTNTKTIKKQDENIVKSATELSTKTTYEYLTNLTKEVKSNIKLEDTKTEAKIASIVINDNANNTSTLPIVTKNNVKLNILLKTDNEQYDLYKEPTVKITLPVDVVTINLNSINLLHEDELKIKSYRVLDNRTILVELENKQTQYKNASIEGAIIAIDADIQLDRKASTKDDKIEMECTNGEKTVTDKRDVNVVAPKSVTAVSGIRELNIETIGEDEARSITLQRGAEAKQLQADIEIINNNQNQIKDIRVMGILPTDSKNSNSGIKIVAPISIEGIEGAQVYYTENEDATDDIKISSNGWKNQIEDNSKVKKYLIVISSLDKQTSVKGNYKFEVPELLEYNKKSELEYTVKYTDGISGTNSEINSTKIVLETGVGPVLEAKLNTLVGKEPVEQNGIVKVGEVIKYKVEISNTGSENVKDVKVKANVPDGTTLVKPQDNYEYTGTSYYKELDNRTIEATIEDIPVGKVVSKEYEVRVNNNVNENTTISNIVETQYGDVTKKTNESKLKTAVGALRVTVKRVTDRNIDLYETGNVKYFAIVENISNKVQNNVTVKTSVPNNMKVEGTTLLTGMKDLTGIETGENIVESNVESEKLEYSENINIGKLEPGEVKVVAYNMSIGKVENSTKSEFSVEVASSNTQYKSNVISNSIKKANISLSMTSDKQNQYVKSGDSIVYTIKVKNNGAEEVNGVVVRDIIPNYLNVEKVLFDDKEIEELKDANNISIYCNLKAGTESIIKIETIVKYSVEITRAQAITNVAYAEFLDETIATTESINSIIQVEDQNDINKTDDEDEKEPSTDDTNVENNIITGVAWFDENANGQRESNEKTLDNVKVTLLNIQTNSLEKDSSGNILEATTNENGIYVLDNIQSGKYLVLFDYDKTKYAITKYKVSEVEESKNSNAMTTELFIDNEKQQVTATDIIEINNNNISDINIGFVELKDFAFKLDKYVTRILIQDAKGTTIKEYTDATIAKAELDGKNINGATVIIEYEIKVTNIGEVDGYVRKIVDYMPKTLKFSSELNKDWYQTGENVYNTSLANEKISAGQSKSIKITLTKSMTENNTGLINNTAEIAESYNDLGIKDTKSISGNKAKDEADYGSADVILGLKTGGEVYVTIFVVVMAILGVTGYIIIKNKSKNKSEYKI